MDIIIFHALFSEINLLQGDTVPLTEKSKPKKQDQTAHKPNDGGRLNL